MPSLRVEINEGAWITIPESAGATLIVRILTDFRARFVSQGSVIAVPAAGFHASGYSFGQISPDVAFQSCRGRIFVFTAPRLLVPALGLQAAVVWAFFNRRAAVPILPAVPWGVSLWFADSPAHLIHFDGGSLSGCGSGTPA